MIGLRTQEDYRFVTFFKMIQKEAEKTNCIFFLDTGNGHSEFSDSIICSDCSGWLVPNDKSEEFRKEYENFKDNEGWEDFAAWVTWERKNDDVFIKIELI